jgi:regulator of protease activity HflC (stomatin/prohibitin superfamily)
MTRTSSQSTRERTLRAGNGWTALAIAIVCVLLAAVMFFSFLGAAAVGGDGLAPRILLAIVLAASGVFIFAGLFTLQPNEARVLILFGSYKGTVRDAGFKWANPFYARHRGKAAHGGDGSAGAKAVEVSKRLLGLANLPSKISLRAHNFNSDRLKVNDSRGNPIEIAAVVVWRVADSAQAVFDVEDYESYVEIQSESAIRSVASRYAYDQGEEDELTLRGAGDEVAKELERELQSRLEMAGIRVEEARLTHLAYAPEIASAMLRRQQAEAVIAARHKIVQGAVSMVEMALKDLEDRAVVHLDEERRAAMVSNLLVVLCGTSEASPVINTGTLYT